MLLDMHGRNTRNDDVQVADQRVLNECLQQLESNHQQLKEILSEPADEYVEDRTKYMSRRCASS